MANQRQSRQRRIILTSKTFMNYSMPSKKIIELQLTETQRTVLWMRDYEGYSFAKIAEHICMTEDNARQILSRARKTVRETYKSIN